MTPGAAPGRTLPPYLNSWGEWMEQHELEHYRAGLAARRGQQRDKMEARRLCVLSQAREAAAGLLALGGQRVLLFGSVLRPHRFHERSDVDMLLYGLPAEKFSAALGLVEMWPGLEEVEIDLKLAEDQRAEFVSAVEEQGEFVP